MNNHGFGEEPRGHKQKSYEMNGMNNSIPMNQTGNPSTQSKVAIEFDKVNKEEKKKKEIFTILKNIILISVAFFFNFTSFISLTRLQSSLHIDQGMGTTNQAILYVGTMISCMFLNKLAIKKLGHKWCIASSFVGYILWMGANGIGRWWSMTPTSIIVGLAGAALLTAQCSYFTLCALRYADLTGESSQAVVTRFFGIFYFIFQLSGLVGSVILSTILNPKSENTTEPTEAALRQCGRNDCPWNNVTNINLEKPEPHVLWTMIGVYMAVASLAVIIIVVFMDKLPKELDDKETSKSLTQDIRMLLVATFRHLRHIPQILLIPISMYSGFKETYFSAEWSKSFISCGLGIWMVGFATIPYGIVNACVCLITGRLVKHIGRIPIFILGALLDFSIQITLNIWMPRPSNPAVFYVISALFGVTDGIWKTQISGVYGSIFANESEAAFSNYRLWQSLGHIIAFGYSSALCTLVKTIVLTCMLCIGMAGYLATEVYIRREKTYRKYIQSIETKS